MKLFIDDIRECPKGFILARSYSIALSYIESGDVDFISFDHDLGGSKTGYDIAKFIELCVFYGRMKCPKWKVHSANPVGRKNINDAMTKAMEYHVKNMGK